MPNLVGQEGSFDYPGFDYAAPRTKIARKLALAQALQRQGLDPISTDRQVGGWAVPISPFEGAAKLAQVYFGAKVGHSAEGNQAELAKQAQGDYRTALGKALANSGLDPGEIDSITAAGSNPMASQMMPFITGIAQQKRQMKMLQDWLGGQGVPGQAQAAPAAPQEGAGTVLAPGAPGAMPAAGGGQLGTMPVGARNVMGGAMMGIPGLTELGKMQHADSQNRGDVRYDQNGKAFVMNANGTVQYLDGITARDKGVPVDTGGAVQFSNEYTGGPVGAPIQKGLNPEAQRNIPLAEQKQAFETGLPTPRPIQPQGMPQQQAIPVGAPPVGRPLPIPTAAPVAPQGRQPIPVPSPGVTPKAQAEINATRAGDKPTATAALGDATNNLDRLAKEVQGIMDDPALSRITGLTGIIPNAPGSAATNVAARLEAVKSQVAFAVLQAMRNSSKTGGALGSVSNFEEQMLQNNLAAVTNTRQSPESMRENLKKIIDYAQGAKGRLAKAYKDTYGEDFKLPDPTIDKTSGAIVKPYTPNSGKPAGDIEELLNKYK